MSQFISAERERFAVQHNNMFAFAFAEIQRYKAFLQIIVHRHTEAGELFKAYTLARLSGVEPDTNSLLSSQLDVYSQVVNLSTHLELETESFYLFAKIMLDEVARAIEFYFGPARNLSLDSHDQLTKNLERYADDRALSMTPKLSTMACKLKSDISDFRDYQIAHHKNPRTTRGHLWNIDSSPRMTLISIYPTAKDCPIESRHLSELLSELEDYVELVIDLLELNRDKTNLELVKPRQQD